MAQPVIGSAELRKRFRGFFDARGHTWKASDSLVPGGDPTVLFTSAGMNQFKEYFLGKRTDLTRAASCQKCLRTGDLDRVGRTPGHHSFFEMLGNFSFGDYFKAEAIAWAWEFLTGTTDYAGAPSPDRDRLCLALPAARLWVSVYEEDEEAFRLWRRLGLPEERIRRFGQAENFWPANAPTEGPNGPCGPCSEIYYDADERVEGPRSVEVWNLVFTQYDRQPDGALKPLPKPNIDTGMGLERLATVMQEVATDYETDLFAPIIAAIRKLGRGEKAKPDRVVFAERVIADHIRAIVFLIAEGLRPSNESRGYVLRMLIRRAHRFGRVDLNLYTSTTRTFLSSLVGSVEEAMQGSPYRAMLEKQRDVVWRAIRHEEMQFVHTLEVGTNRLNELMASSKGKTIAGDEAFKLYDTYGFPLELTIDVAQERGFTVERTGFETAFKTQQERSRVGSQFTGGVFVADTLGVRDVVQDLPSKEAQFIGYELLASDAVIKGLWDGAAWVAEASAGASVGIVLERSPFYGEAGGQVGDQGTIESPRGLGQVIRTTWADELLVHHTEIKQGRLAVGDPIRATVDAQRRLKVARSHTATHLVHWALRKVLGPETAQAGSLVEVERVRFDFSSRHPLTEEQRQEVAALIDSRVRLGDAVATAQMPLEEAKRAGALALFGEQYGSLVRVVTIGDYSKELCGGTHVAHTGCVGSFLITGEGAIAAGTRRLEVLIGEAAAQRLYEQRRLLYEASQRLGRPAQEVVAGLEELLEQVRRLERERKALQERLARVEAARLVAEGKSIHGVTVVTATIKQANREWLAMLADAVRQALEREGVVLLASAEGPAQVSLVMATTRDLANRVHAGQLLKAVAPLTHGSGGGRPEFAQAGGKDPAGIPAALRRVEELLRETLG